MIGNKIIRKRVTGGRRRGRLGRNGICRPADKGVAGGRFCIGQRGGPAAGSRNRTYRSQPVRHVERDRYRIGSRDIMKTILPQLGWIVDVRAIGHVEVIVVGESAQVRIGVGSGIGDLHAVIGIGQAPGRTTVGVRYFHAPEAAAAVCIQVGAGGLVLQGIAVAGSRNLEDVEIIHILQFIAVQGRAGGGQRARAAGALVRGGAGQALQDQHVGVSAGGDDVVADPVGRRGGQQLICLIGVQGVQG